MNTETERALEEFDLFCRFIDGMHMNGFVENDFMGKSVQAIVRRALQQNEKLVGALKRIASEYSYAPQMSFIAEQALAEYEKETT